MRIGVGLAMVLLSVEVTAVMVLLADGDRVLRLPVSDWMPKLSATLAIQVAALWLALTALLLAGVLARAAAVGLVGLIVFVQLLDQSLYSNHLVLAGILLALLAATRPAQVWTLGRRQPRPVPCWPLWLVKTQLSTLYLFTGLAKLNEQFLSGRVITTFSQEWLGAILERRSWLAAALAVGAVVTELAFAVAIWVPRTHRLLLPAAVTFHLAIAVTVVPTLPLVTFAVLTLSAYPAFIDLTRRRAHR